MLFVEYRNVSECVVPVVFWLRISLRLFRRLNSILCNSSRSLIMTCSDIIDNQDQSDSRCVDLDVIDMQPHIECSYSGCPFLGHCQNLLASIHWLVCLFRVLTWQNGEKHFRAARVQISSCSGTVCHKIPIITPVRRVHVKFCGALGAYRI